MIQQMMTQQQQMMTQQQQMMTQQMMNQAAEQRFSPNVTAPPYGPRPACYEVAQGNFPPPQFMMQAPFPPQGSHPNHMTQ